MLFIFICSMIHHSLSVFFYTQKTAYDMRISDWSSDVCSADLYDLGKKTYQLKLAKPDHKQYLVFESGVRLHTTKFQRERQTVPSVFCLKEIGRASCRERVCP